MESVCERERGKKKGRSGSTREKPPRADTCGRGAHLKRLWVCLGSKAPGDNVRCGAKKRERERRERRRGRKMGDRGEGKKCSYGDPVAVIPVAYSALYL